MLLDSVLLRCASSPRPVVVFDLDGTLIDTSRRHEIVFRQFLDAHGADFPAVRSAAPTIARAEFRFHVWDPLAARGLATDALRAALLEFWVPRYFSDLCEVDDPWPGGVEFAEACRDAGARLVFATGRREDRMRAGTEAWLDRMGLPRGSGSLIMKPKGGPRDLDWKLALLPQVDAQGKVVASFENEPAHCNAWLAHWPDALHFCIESGHTDDAPPLDPRVVSIADYR
jgi:hypothetical protein